MPARPSLHSQALRAAGWVLALLLLTLSAAGAAPLLHRQDFRSICTATPVSAGSRNPLGDGPPKAPSLDCPLCLPMLAPAPGQPTLAPATGRPLAAQPWGLLPGAVVALAQRPPVRAPPVDPARFA